MFVTWCKDGRPLYASDRYGAKVTKDMCILECVHESNKDTSGKYSCAISNSCGTDVCYAEVTVLEFKHEDSKDVPSDYSCDVHGVGGDDLYQSPVTTSRGLYTTLQETFSVILLFLHFRLLRHRPWPCSKSQQFLKKMKGQFLETLWSWPVLYHCIGKQDSYIQVWAVLGSISHINTFLVIIIFRTWALCPEAGHLKACSLCDEDGRRFYSNAQ